MFRRDWLITASVLAAIAIALTVAMIRSRPISDEDLREARAVVKRYLGAYGRHDGRAICAELMPEVREQIARSDDPRACAQELSRRSRIPEDTSSTRPRARVMRDQFHDDRIAVSLEWSDGSAAGMGMRHVGGRWLLDSDQSCVTPSCRP